MRSISGDLVGRRGEFMEREMMIPLGDVTLAGDLQVPADAGGLVIFAHGSGSSRHSPRNQFVAQELRNHNSGTLLFDLLTKLEEVEDAEHGHLRFNMLFLTHRLLQVTEWISRHPAARHLPLGYFGSSTGAAAALRAAATLPSVRAVVSRGGRPDLAADSLRKVSATTLFIVGQLDQEVVRLNRQAFALLHCPKDMVVIPRATHLFEEPGALEDVAAIAARWFASAWQECATSEAPQIQRQRMSGDLA